MAVRTSRKYRLIISNAINRLAELFNYTVIIQNKQDLGPGHERIHPPTSTYSPWLIDEEFKSVMKQVGNNTLVDDHRCFELWQLVSEVKNVSGALIEIGVWKGGTGALIAKAAELNNINDTVYLCDTFEGIVKSSDRDPDWDDGDLSKGVSKKLVKNLVFSKMNLKNVKVLKGIFPDDTSEQIHETKFRFCHIDVDVYNSAEDIMDWIWDKMSIGGVIVYDDYGTRHTTGIIEFVNEQRGMNDRVIIHNLNGHAVVIKTS